ncbi:DNA translocase FtsK [Metabacillus bambusae]|uniref:DNA translocase FtsK n=1 Tax=Metabacillus bambusae TaxID=2795218 RepID=A0ABS3N4I2_9BACI|nr:DNA translocase FtsK [Metabacillus bambusae]MBO1513202.1 DNA translocase FtsK [Metabacillus bambusae]
MNWLTKLVSYFSGEDEKEYEKKAELQDDLNAHSVFNTPSSVEGKNRTNITAEAKVAYQYPKGNFRFPMIPDEKLASRDERSKRPTRTYDYQKHSGEVPFTPKSPATKPKINPKKADEKPKRPFSPTAIPSPIYGFQTKEERIMTRPQLQVENRGINGSLLSKTEEKQSSRTVIKNFQQEKQEKIEQNDTEINFVRKQNSMVEKEDKHTEMSFSHEEIEETQLNSNANVEENLEVNDLRIDDDLSQFNTFYEEETLGIEEQKQEIQISELELEVSLEEDEMSLINLEDESTIWVTREPLTAIEEEETQLDSVQVNSPEINQLLHRAELDEEEFQQELHNTVIESELENTFVHMKDPIQQEVLPEDTRNNVNLSHEEERLEENEQQIVNHHQENYLKEEDEYQPIVPHQENLTKDEKQKIETKTRNNTLPFNVMMLGRDKQRMRAKEDSYQFPSLAFLNVPDKEVLEDHSWLNDQKELLDVTLKNFNVRASVVNVTQGPSVTRFEVHPEPGVKVNKITNLSDDIKLSLSAKDIRIEAPIPGKNTIGIEVPNKVSKMVYLREIIRSPEFRTNPSPMTAVLGLDISGQPAVTDLKKMPHGLIAGATGSGKSVCINTILVSLLYKASPHEVKLMLIDPKMVELAPYNEIPHLVSPVITDVKAATAALKWAVEEMERRYELFAHSGTREITRYNQLVKEHKQGEHLPYLVIVIDELADLMMVAPNDVEEAICRIAQKARACGIHLIVATQRPSVDVITGLIKANIPTRIAFSVSSQVDSRTIIDVNGAEKLLGKGDMLFLENGSSKAVRLQGTFVSDEEIERVVKHVRHQSKPDYLFHQDELVKKAIIQSEEDELFPEACEFVVNQGGASTSLLQRRFRIGYNRAARLIDMMEEQGIISENRGSKPRDILISEEELDSIQSE